MNNDNKSLDCLLFSSRACIVWDSFFFILRYIVYLAFQKVLDNISLTSFLKKLNRHGIRGNIFAWIYKSKCVEDRKQSIGTWENSQFSSWKKVTSGVLLLHVEDPCSSTCSKNHLRKGPNREMATFADGINFFGVEMMDAKELFTRVIW